jgi:transcription-repair coupling factor (superfamily II helicase)
MFESKKIVASPFQALRKKIGTQHVLPVSTLHGSSKTLLFSLLAEQISQLVLVYPDIREAQETVVELNLLELGDRVLEITDFSKQALQERLTEIGKRKQFIICTTYEFFTTPAPPKAVIDSRTTMIEAGSAISYEDVTEYLNSLYYQKQQFVEAPGDYAKRGAIIDFWSYSERLPVRLEFDGDFIESMRYFDPESQRSVQSTVKVTLAPQIEEQSVEYSTKAIYAYLSEPVFVVNEAILRGTQVSVPDTQQQAKQAPKVPVIDEDAEIPPDPELLQIEEAINETEKTLYDLFLEEWTLTPKTAWVIERMFSSDREALELKLGQAPAVNSNYKVLFAVLQEFAAKAYRIFLTVENDLQLTRYQDLLSDMHSGVADFIESGKLRIIVLPIKEGFCNHTDKMLVLTDYQIFNKPYRTKLPSKTKKGQSKSRKLESIKPGDFVVHEEYGVGKFTGLEEISIGESTQESMKLLYNEGGIVYVNLNYLHLVKKFSAKEGITPSLSTLGSAEWVNKKRKAKKRIKEAARELIELYARRKLSQGYSFSADSVWQNELEASFIYEDTPDQAKVTGDVKSDMEANNPMDRLVCGDVGFGKTEIAVRAAFKAVQDGKQVAVLAPTTILVEQHFNTFHDRLQQFPVTIAALSRFQKKVEQKEIIKGLSEGKVDIVIGTHRLLSKDVGFHDLGLLIIDEEHRFGVKSKEKLREYKLNLDILTLTATPIPRTLNLSLLGARDLSLITTPPPNRQPIYTRVDSFETAHIKDWVYSELKRGGQIYIVHDRIQSIDKFASYLKRIMPDIKLCIAHGQMKPGQLEDVFHGFLHRKYDVLLATKIIESGLDMPNVNTIIINRADRFGLSELHQLRGRVGRSDKQAYAYLLVPSMNSLNKNTVRRLKAIEEYSDIGAGFSLSMRDLEIRGAGNLLGTEQTGFIDEIGFDMYIKLINESVEEIRQEEYKEVFKDLPMAEQKADATIETYFEIGIPNAYIPEQMDRLSYYTALYSVKIIEELAEIEEEMRDRFGPPPALVQRLFKSAELKYYASRAFFERVIIQRKQVIIVLPKGDNTLYYETKFGHLAAYIMDHYKDTIKIQQQNDSIKLLIRREFEFPEKAIELLTAFAKNVYGLMKGQKELL